MEESVKPKLGGNQWTPDPRQDLFLSYYLDPNSETFSNAYQSALKAGYSEEYSQNLTRSSNVWLSEAVSDARLVSLATKNLETALVGGLDDPEKGGKPLQMRATEFSLKGLQKAKWSERSEMTGKDGKDLIPETLSQEEIDKLRGLLKS